MPKKESTVRFISDFRELNKRILRQPYPIPKIQDLLLRLEGFRYGTTLDLNMGYYHIRGSSPDLGLNLGLFDYCTSRIFQRKMILPVLPDRRRFGVNSKTLENPESQYNPRAPWRPFR